MSESSQARQRNSQLNSQEVPQEKKLTGAKGLLHLLFVRKWHPQPTVNTTMLIFAVVGVLFIILGIMISIFNSTIIEVEKAKYEDEKNCVPISENDKTCIIKISINESDMEPPIYLFYTLDNFYQNHRRYMKSKSTDQLTGKTIDESEAKSACEPAVYNKDFNLPYSQAQQKYQNWKGQFVLEPNAIANPCGLIAKSYFNDSYNLYSDEDTTDEIPIDTNNISWPEDSGKKYKQAEDDAEKAKQWINPQDEHFIVWMRTSGLPNFRKLWGKIDQKLESGKTYYLKVVNQYDVDSFQGSKGILLSTAGPLGGKNQFLNAAFLVVGVICIVIALVFYFKKKVTNGNFGEAKKSS